MVKLTALPGFFKQSLAETDPASFDLLKAPSFGLVDQTYDLDEAFDAPRERTQWQRFERYLRHLNEQASSGVAYKLVYIGRHGEGYHNVAEAKFGTKEKQATNGQVAWDDHYSLLKEHEGITFFDARLTSLGISQIESTSQLWRTQITTQNQSLPEAFYVSPLTRCLQTADITFSPLMRFAPPDLSTSPSTSHSTVDGSTAPVFKPTIKERIREQLGEHTCDARSSRSSIRARYPTWSIEPGFTENDELWDPHHRETDEEMVLRLRRALEDILCNESKMIVSLTGHSGMLRACLRVLGHRAFFVRTGQVVPLVVRVERDRSQLVREDE